MRYFLILAVLVLAGCASGPNELKESPCACWEHSRPLGGGQGSENESSEARRG